MRCPECGHVQGWRRDGIWCRRCHYTFFFNPNDALGLSDRRALAEVRRVSADGGHAFTARQLIGSVASRRRLLWRTPTLSQWDLDRAVAHLTGLALAHPQRFERMLTTPMMGEAGTSSWPEHDIFDYGAERIVVVDQPILVDLLVHAGVHTSARAIVIDISGYPRRITELAQELVRERSDTPVAMLHASGTETTGLGAAIVHLLHTSAPLLDVGLSRTAWRSIPSIRWARGHASLPADALPWRLLTGALVEALLSDRPLSEVAEGDGDHAISDGDYG